MVTLLTPIDRPEFVPLIAQCVLSQTWTDFEWLVIDNSPTPVRDLLPADDRIRYFRTGHANIGTLRNFGAQVATGDAIVHMDADDYSAPTRVATQMERLRVSGKSVTGYRSLLWWDGLRGGRVRTHVPFAYGTSLCYKREWWLAHPFREITFGEDTEFSTMALAHGELDSIDGGEELVVRVHEGSAIDIRLDNECYLSAEELPTLFPRS